MPLRLKVVMFTDRVGSSAGATHGGDAARGRINDLLDRFTREAMEKAGGRVIKSLGDGHLVTFDSAAQALRGGWRLQQRLGEHNRTAGAGEPISIRIGIDAGDVEEAPDGDIAGHAADMAKRVEGAAAAGDVCYSERVRALLPTRFADDAGHPAPGQPTALKGGAEPVQLYRLVRLHDAGPDTFASPFVVSRPVSEPPEFFGRTREIRDLLAALRNSQSRSVVGPHRIGKSSLLRHVAARFQREERRPAAFLDMRNIAHHSLAGVLGVIHAQFALAGKAGTLVEFNDRFREAAAAGLRAMLVFDGIEIFVRNRQIGRPKLAKGEAKSCMVRARVTPADLKAIERAANGVGGSEWARNVMLSAVSTS